MGTLIRINVLVFVLFLNSCALIPGLPSALTYLGNISTIADVVTYVSTGKTATDHAVSGVVGKDCALMRVIDGEKICYKDNEKLVDEMMDMTNCTMWSFNVIDEPVCINIESGP